MSKAERTKKYIVSSVSELFNKQGYSNTSLSDITGATGLTKGSIYGNFSNKEDVAQAVYKFNAERIGKDLLTAVNTTKGDAIQQLEAIIEYYRTNWAMLAERGGCPLLNAAIEADDTSPRLSVAVQRSFKSFEKMIAQLVEKGQQQNVFKSDSDAEDFAASFIMLLEGGIMLAKIHNNVNYLEISLNALSKKILAMRD